MQAAGARYCAIAPIEDIPNTAHVMGTLRFGTDPRTSVCDATGKFHDLGNLYAADGALFPTSSGFNPILTIVTPGLALGIAYFAWRETPMNALTVAGTVTVHGMVSPAACFCLAPG